MALDGLAENYWLTSSPEWLSDGVAVSLGGYEQSEVRIFDFDDGAQRGRYVEPTPALTVGGFGLHGRARSIANDRLVFSNIRHMVVLDRMGHKLGGTLMAPGCGGVSSLVEAGDRLMWLNLEENPQMLYTFDLSLL